MIGFWIVVGLGLVVFTVLLLRGKNRSAWPLSLAGWTGGLLAAASFIFLPWVTFGPPQTFEQNARWVLEKSNALELIENFPPVKEAFLGRPRSVNDLRRLLTDPDTAPLLDEARAGRGLTGWQTALASFQSAPLLAIALFAGGLAGIILGLLSLAQLVGGPAPGRAVSIAAAGLALMAVLVLFNQISYLDCLNRTGDFKLRLLAAFLQSNTGPGGWVFIIGLALAAGCGLCGLSLASNRADTGWDTLSDNPDHLTLV